MTNHSDDINEPLDESDLDGTLAAEIADALGEALLAQRLILEEMKKGGGHSPIGAFATSDLSRLLHIEADQPVQSNSPDRFAADAESGTEQPRRLSVAKAEADPAASTGTASSVVGKTDPPSGSAADGDPDSDPDSGPEPHQDIDVDEAADEAVAPAGAVPSADTDGAESGAGAASDGGDASAGGDDPDDDDEPKERKRRLRLPVVPLRNTILFPQQVIPLAVGRDRSVRAVEEAMEGGRRILVVAQIDGRKDSPGPADIYRWGSVANILKVFEMPDGTRNIIVQGMARARILELDDSGSHSVSLAETYYDEAEDSIETEALATNLRQLLEQIGEIAPYLTPDHLAMVASVTEPGHLADALISVLGVSVKEKQEILEIATVGERLQRTVVVATKELQKLEIGHRIQSEVQGEINKTQRDYFLREQLKAIQRELGDGEDASEEVRELRERVQKSRMPADVKAAANKELDRLGRIHPSSPEYTVSRTYLDVLLDLPWKKYSRDRLDIAVAREILDSDHYGLERVKKRILEFLAVRKLKKDMRGPILCFVGPPGVGKTSLGRSIARALKRKFYRFSLGGMRDEAEIRGHRRTYIGAMPGRVIQGLKRIGTANPVFMLDEIDKLGSDFRGDPSSALLEVLDPEQNHAFSDHYLDQPFDLSKVLFIATANMLDTVPPALRDRMEIIEVPGYTRHDKTRIAQDFLIPKQIEAHGLKPSQIEISEDALKAIIESHTREAGVRNLERQIGAVCRGVARRIAEGTSSHEEIGEENLVDYLGQPRFFLEEAERFTRPGIATGLAWTPVGGDLLFIEATRMPGKGNMILSGRLGEVMKESAGAALSYIRSRAEELGVDPTLAEKWDVHVHVPAGAVPKDGPSAGIAIYTALMSLFTNRCVCHDTAMTGEITLRGAVLPVGGVKEKLLAAHRGGIRRVILPEKNRRDLDEVPEEVRDDMEFHFVGDLDTLLPLVLRAPQDTAAGGGAAPAAASVPATASASAAV
jgi:ATP-dependent Lon protease